MPNDGTWACSDVALQAAKRALEDAGMGAEGRRLHHPRHALARHPLPGDGGVPPVEARHRRRGGLRLLRHPAAVLGLPLQPADGRRVREGRPLPARARRRRGAPQPLARLHDAGRDVTVLFGDGAGAVVVGPVETDERREGDPLHQGRRRRLRRDGISTSRSSRSSTCPTSGTTRAATTRSSSSTRR